jgi:hypothetical protein
MTLLTPLRGGPIDSIRGRRVERVDKRHWSIDHGPPRLLLPAIDALVRPATPDGRARDGGLD